MLAVFLLVAISFRSLRLGLASLLPLALTLAISFGVMGATGTNVDLVTAMLGSIAINRKAGRKAIDQLITQGRQRLEDGRWVVVFPEGTRTEPGQPLERRTFDASGSAAVW